MARRPRAAVSSSPSSTPTLPTTRTATAQATESTRTQKAPLGVVLDQASVLRRLFSRLGGVKWNGHVQLNIYATTPAPRVHCAMARRHGRVATKTPSFTPTPQTTQTATAQATESTRIPRAPLRVVLVQAGVFRMHLSSLRGDKRNGHVKKHLGYDPGPLRALPHGASSSSSGFVIRFSTPALPTTQTATAQATESTSKLRASLRVVLVQAGVFRRLLPRLSCVRRNGHVQKNAFATTSTSRVHRSMARRLRGADLASPFSTPTPPTTRTATAQATESTSELLTPFRVVLV